MAVFAGYCALADVQAHNQEHSYNATSKPTNTQVDDWISRIGIEINMTLDRLGFVTPVVAPTAEDALEWLKELNALGAAAKAESAANAASMPNESDHATALWKQYQTKLKELREGHIVLDAPKVSDSVLERRSESPLSHMDDATLALTETDTAADFRIDKAMEQW